MQIDQRLIAVLMMVEQLSIDATKEQAHLCFFILFRRFIIERGRDKSN